MTKLEETNTLIKYIIDLRNVDVKVDDSVLLADIAKSVAMIADKLCGEESEDKV